MEIAAPPVATESTIEPGFVRVWAAEPARFGQTQERILSVTEMGDTGNIDQAQELMLQGTDRTQRPFGLPTKFTNKSFTVGALKEAAGNESIGAFLDAARAVKDLPSVGRGGDDHTITVYYQHDEQPAPNVRKPEVTLSLDSVDAAVQQLVDATNELFAAVPNLQTR